MQLMHSVQKRMAKGQVDLGNRNWVQNSVQNMHDALGAALQSTFAAVGLLHPLRGSRKRIAVWALLMAAGALLSACASTGNVVGHSFGFDVRGAKPAVELLDYRYGTSGLPGARPASYQVDAGKVGSASGVAGHMTIGDSLYVKWQTKETGQIFEKTVDLRHRLPLEMENKKVCFYIVGSQLYVYVVNPGFLPVGAPEEEHPEAPIKRMPYTYHSSYRIIYPDQPKH